MAIALPHWLRLDAITQHAAKLSAGAALSLVITVVTTPVLTRLYGPDAFGLYGVFSAVLAVVALASTGRYEQAIALPKSDREAASLVRLTQRAVLLTSACACTTIPFKNVIAERLGHPALAPWFWALPVAIWLAGNIQISSAYAVRNARFGHLARARLIQTFAAVGLQFALIASGALALLASLLGGMIAQFAWMRRGNGTPATPGPFALSHAAAEYRHFPLYVLPAALIDSLTFQLPAVLGSAWFGVSFVGMYWLATRILGLPVNLVGAAYAQVFYQDFSRRPLEAPETRQFLFQTWLKLAALGAIPFLALAYFSDDLFRYVFGSEWREAGDLATVLSPMFFAMLVSSPTSGALLVLKGQHLALGFSVSFLCYRVGGFWVAAHFDNYLLGLGLIAAAEIATIFIYNLTILRRLGRRAS